MTTIISENSSMVEKVLLFPTQVADAFSLAKYLVLPKSYRNISSIVILGMGGSGVVGDFLQVLLRNSSMPVYICKDSVPPRYVNQHTLVFAISYSGKTEETLNAVETCISSGAKVVGITTGHELKSICDEKGIPCITIPENGHSRASLGYLLVPLLWMLNSIGFLPRIEYAIIETVEILNKIKKQCSPALPLKRNPARFLATNLLDRFPIIYAQYNFTNAVALRWKQQLNENSKVHCYCDNFPELLHNEIEAWRGEEGVNENFAVILLRDLIHERDVGLERKIWATKNILQTKGCKIFEFWTEGKSELARLLSLSYIGDFVSTYIAMAKGIDASVVRNIEFIKRFGSAKESVTNEWKQV